MSVKRLRLAATPGSKKPPIDATMPTGGSLGRTHTVAEAAVYRRGCQPTGMGIKLCTGASFNGEDALRAAIGAHARHANFQMAPDDRRAATALPESKGGRRRRISLGCYCCQEKFVSPVDGSALYVSTPAEAPHEVRVADCGFSKLGRAHSARTEKGFDLHQKVAWQDVHDDGP